MFANAKSISNFKSINLSKPVFKPVCEFYFNGFVYTHNLWHALRCTIVVVLGNAVSDCKCFSVVVTEPKFVANFVNDELAVS